MKKKEYVGINIQYPISRLILDGKKTIETRLYPIPPKYVSQELALVETPGKSGKFKSRIIAIIKFGPCFEYQNKKEFYSDTPKHCVDPGSPWAWNGKSKWGWPVRVITVFKKPIPVKKRLGIKFTNNLSI